MTLSDGALIAHEAVLGPVDPDLRERYIAETRILGAMFGIPPETLPQDWTEFARERDRLLASDELTVTAPARHIAGRLVMDPPLPLLRSTFPAVTAHLLPDRLRREYGFDFGPAERRRAERAVTWLARIYPHLPLAPRYVGPYHEATGRLRGRLRPTPLARALNRIWIGSGALPGPKRPSA